MADEKSLQTTGTQSKFYITGDTQSNPYKNYILSIEKILTSVMGWKNVSTFRTTLTHLQFLGFLRVETSHSHNDSFPDKYSDVFYNLWKKH